MTGRIIIESVEATAMRAPYRVKGAGDWFYRDGDLVIRIAGSDILQDDETFLLALHELVEAKLCDKGNIPETVVNDYDFRFRGVGEPGDGEDSPYRKPHRFACLIEFLMAWGLGLHDYGTME